VAPQSNVGLYEELVRLRDRVHELANRVTTVELQTIGMKETLEKVDRKVDRLATADEVARAVADHDRENQRVTLTRTQKSAVLGALGIIAANLILRLAGIEGLG
jgi:hypothetical protein